MSLPGSRRCFECGTTYPGSGEAGPALIRCPLDGSPLGVDLTGRRWRGEAALGPRPGGGVFVAYHLITGARAAVSLIYDAREGELEQRMNQEVQAQRLLEPHPNLFKLLELGNERDGTRFYVSELLAEQTLHNALKQWRRPEEPTQLFAAAGGVIRPLLGLLATAHRLGIAHGELDDTNVYVMLADAPEGQESRLSTPKLYGLRRLGPGPALVEAVRADMRGMGQLLHLLLFGELAQLPLSVERQAAILAEFGEPAGSFILRSLDSMTAGREGRFATVDEMQRSLTSLRRDISIASRRSEGGGPEGMDPSVDRTSPAAAPSRASGSRRPPAGSRESAPAGATPLPELPLPGQQPFQKSTFSGELRQVSFADLLTMPAPAATDEVMARGTYQVPLPDKVLPEVAAPTAAAGGRRSSTELRPEPIAPADNEDDLDAELEIEVVSPSSSASAGGALTMGQGHDPVSAPPPPPQLTASAQQAPVEPERAQPAAQPGKFKLWGWWRR